MVHYPNPFDFIPFVDEGPDLKTPSEWALLDKLFTGYLELTITALTPVHIAGKQEASEDGKRIIKSHFYRQNGKACIPAFTIRGMLRSFIEAACNCWVSQVTPFYLNVKDKRNLSFMVIDVKEEFEKKGGEYDPQLKLSLRSEFWPKVGDEGKVDLASYLFGFIPDEKEREAWHGVINIEDAFLSGPVFKGDSGDFQIPDVEVKAFMGSPNPSAKTWWYHRPCAIRKRKEKRVMNGKERELITLDFLGNGFRGRKFYYHQDPITCVSKYLPKDWPKLYHIKIECIPPGKKTDVFRIYFDEIPQRLLYLLLWSLAPGHHIRHKLGYAKAYGYGSVFINVENCHFRSSAISNQEPFFNEFIKETKTVKWDLDTIKNKRLDEFIHQGSLEKLAKVLFYKEPLNLIFLYPKFSREGFIGNISMNDLREVSLALGYQPDFSNDLWEVTPEQAYKIADALSKKEKKEKDRVVKGIKPTLHFEVYQKNALGYQEIQNRTLTDA